MRCCCPQIANLIIYQFQESIHETNSVGKTGILKGFAKPERPRVFCASLADVFDNAVPRGWRMDLFELIARTPHLDWLIVTKRVGNVMQMCQHDGLMFDQLANIWLGITVCNQEEADRDIPKLLVVPARVRFLSMEPLLGPVDLVKSCWESWIPNRSTHIDWVVVGGESGHNARPIHPDWARGLRDQCAEAGVPFLFKQWGEHDHRTIRMGKKVTGRLLDGVQHDGYPEVHP